MSKRVDIRLTFRAEPTHEKDDKADQQHQTQPAAADDRAAKEKPTAAEQKKQNYQEQYHVHDGDIIPHGRVLPWGLTPRGGSERFAPRERDES